MLIGYVSDETYVGLADVALEFTNGGGESWEARSRVTGSVHLDLPTDDYIVSLNKPGYGGKRSRLTAATPLPVHFRLLTDGLLGYVWPKCVRAGDKAEFRVHSVE